MADDSTNTQWYWCLDHQRAEPHATMCRAAERLGPFDSEEAARSWKSKSEARNEEWDAEDEEWNAWPDAKGPDPKG